MWYYAKDKEKIGPLSDSAIVKLYADEVISSDSLVWSTEFKEKKWVTFGETKTYKKISAAPKSETLKTFNIVTSILRALFIASLVFLAAKISFMLDSLGHYLNILEGFIDKNSVQCGVLTSINSRTCVIAGQLMFLYAAAVFYFGFKWMYAAASCARAVDKKFNVRPSTAAWSIVLPFVNFILPVKIIYGIIRSAARALHKKPSIFDITLVVLCEFFWVLNFAMIFVRSYGFTRSGNLDMVESFHFLSIYTDILSICSVSLFIILISRIQWLLVKFLADPRNLSANRAAYRS